MQDWKIVFPAKNYIACIHPFQAFRDDANPKADRPLGTDRLLDR